MKTIETVQQDELDIRQLMDEVVVAFNQTDLEKLLSLHTDDIILMEPDMPLIQGKEQVRALFGALEAKKINLQLAFHLDELEVMGERAFVRGQVFKTVIQESVITKDMGKFICLLQKQSNGRWLRTHVIVNNDAAPEVNPTVIRNGISLGV